MSRGVLPTVVRRCVLSRNLKNKEAMAGVCLQRHRGEGKCKIYTKPATQLQEQIIQVAPPSERHCRHKTMHVTVPLFFSKQKETTNNINN